MSNITTTRLDGVLTISLNRPEKMNALTRDMYADLARSLNEAAGDFAVRAVILTSEGAHFTAGNDIKDFLELPPTSEDSTVKLFLDAILEFPKPLLAAVKGNAIGVGTTMLLHCDVVVADPLTSFSMPFVSLGLVPEAGSSLLFPALVGYQRAAKIFMTGESFSAESAQEMGLVAEISSDSYATALKIAQQIAAQPPTAVMKAEFELFAMALTSDEAMEAFMNFMAKKAAEKEKGGK